MWFWDSSRSTNLDKASMTLFLFIDIFAKAFVCVFHSSWVTILIYLLFWARIDAVMLCDPCTWSWLLGPDEPLLSPVHGCLYEPRQKSSSITRKTEFLMQTFQTCQTASLFIPIFLNVLLWTLASSLLAEPCRVWDAALGDFDISRRVVWPLHSRADWKPSEMFSTWGKWFWL